MTFSSFQTLMLFFTPCVCAYCPVRKLARLVMQMAVVTKADLPDVRDAYPDVQATLSQRGVESFLVSAVTHEGIDALMNRIAPGMAPGVASG